MHADDLQPRLHDAGVEIAEEIAQVASHVYHTARTWTDSQLTDSRLRHNMTRLPVLTRLCSNGSAEFSGGHVIQNVDAVVYCTGYKYNYPFLNNTGLIRTGKPAITLSLFWSASR
jgi:hypothetical protein